MKKIYTIILIAMFALANNKADATIHYVLAGASGNNQFLPLTFNAYIGDTIEWISPSGVHNIIGDSIPLGAAALSCGTIPSTAGFSYIPTVAGTYSYHCGLHSESGTFTVSPIPNILADFSMIPDSLYSLAYWTYNSSIGTNLTYNWSFGDGATSTLQSPTHSYATTGSYTVCLRVNDGTNSDSVCNYVNVISAPNYCFAIFNIVHDTASTDPNAYTIANLSFGGNLTYLWNFGDTTTSTLAHPTHTYLGAGPYQLCLSINNGAGCTNSYCDTLVAVDSLRAHLQPISLRVISGPHSPFTVGIKQLATDNEITIAPNPFTSETTISFSAEQKNTSIKITDVLGKEIKTMVLNGARNLTLEKGEMKAGIYFVRITDDTKNVINRKIIIE